MRVNKFVRKLVEQLGGDFDHILAVFKAGMNEVEEISNTRLAVMDCPRRYLLRYGIGLKIREKSGALQVGEAFATGGEIMYKRKSLKRGIAVAKAVYNRHRDTALFDDKDWQDYETNIGFLEVGLESYHREFYWDDIHNKISTEVKMDGLDIIPGYKYMCINDKMVIDDAERWIIEDKTKSQFGEKDVLELDMNGQVLGNILTTQKNLNEKVNRVKYRVTKKPGIRRKLGESLQAFIERLKEGYKLGKNHPKGKIMEVPLIIPQDRVDDFEESLRKRIQVFDHIKKRGAFYANHSQCQNKYGNCEFMDICTCDNRSQYLYKLRGVRH